MNNAEKLLQRIVDNSLSENENELSTFDNLINKVEKYKFPKNPTETEFMKIWHETIEREDFKELKKEIMKMNKYREAYKRLFSQRKQQGFKKGDKEDLELIRELINKETPMKPIRHGRWCGRCDIVRLIKDDDKYCSYCGQKIDWEETC